MFVMARNNCIIATLLSQRLITLLSGTLHQLNVTSLISMLFLGYAIAASVSLPLYTET